jgi:hypothetical protein
LGKRVWVINRRYTDWRWLLEREDSPWYPSLRLFRQPRHGDWDAVVARVAGELRTFAAAAILEHHGLQENTRDARDETRPSPGRARAGSRGPFSDP